MLAPVVLAGLFLVYWQLKLQWEEASMHVQQQTELLSVRNNLIQIGAAADTYFEQESAKEEVAVSELKIWLSGALQLKPVEGEDYDSIVVSKEWQSISLRLPSGRIVDWKKK